MIHFISTLLFDIVTVACDTAGCMSITPIHVKYGCIAASSTMIAHACVYRMHASSIKWSGVIAISVVTAPDGQLASGVNRPTEIRASELSFARSRLLSKYAVYDKQS